ncbi:katanin p60 ATPase-containing subunit A-like 2 isoform X2 [Corvus cornix cornix]|uniref:katanin p60 ATPase-containing subunit A-like 2 isoform X2 n=1 Tax=Corvus cornix cornix TaxID=932674 RepID=UPI000901150F|nr:katanin p60 ATPase-containing subunit A-like 2 isoform X2 [Corvus cornix cornix]
MELFCQALRTTRQAREARLHLDAVYSNEENITFDLEFCLNSQEEMRTEARRKNLLILILHYLIEEGYVDAANALEQETKLGLRGFEVCDNIDLETILMEYESYYFVKFQKYPKITKKVLNTAENKQQLRSGGRAKRTASSSQKVPRVKQQTVQRAVSKTSPGSTTEPKSSTKGSPRQNSDGADTLDQSDFGLSISGISKTGVDSSHPRKGQIIDFHKMIQDAVRVSPDGIPLNSLNYDPDPSERLLKPLSAFIGMTGEMRELAMVVSKDIYLHKTNVKWDDIIGLDAAKRLVKEAVVYPIKYPELFTGILSPWKGLLLYGPPGTGKTLLAKAVATECNTTFFNISASTIVSKWRGDSEKLVRVLFELARYHAPSTIFLDELESVMSQRGTAPGGEHEGSRRMKTELLVQMDGLAQSDDLVFVLAASNLPCYRHGSCCQSHVSTPRCAETLSSSAFRELDSAMLRRLEKRILVDLPSEEARRVMIQHWLPPLSNSGGVKLRTDLDYSLLSQETNGYSGSDIKLVCKEAAMRPVRKIFDALENHQPGNSNLPMIQLDTITTADFLDVITHTKPSAKNLSQKYTAWQREFESV